MLNGIKSLADEVLANLIKVYYPNWYQKCISVWYPKKIYILILYIFININIIIYICFFKRLKNFLKFLQCWQLIIIVQQNSILI